MDHHGKMTNNPIVVVVVVPLSLLFDLANEKYPISLQIGSFGIVRATSRSFGRLPSFDPVLFGQT
jgi:hypothetical protein